MGSEQQGKKSSAQIHESLQKLLSEGKLNSAMRDIAGTKPSEVTVEFEKGKPTVGPAGANSGDGSWDGNIYKYRF